MIQGLRLIWVLLKIIVRKDDIGKVIGAFTIQGNPVVNPSGVPKTNRGKKRK